MDCQAGCVSTLHQVARARGVIREFVQIRDPWADCIDRFGQLSDPNGGSDEVEVSFCLPPTILADELHQLERTVEFDLQALELCKIEALYIHRIVKTLVTVIHYGLEEARSDIDTLLPMPCRPLDFRVDSNLSPRIGIELPDELKFFGKCTNREITGFRRETPRVDRASIGVHAFPHA